MCDASRRTVFVNAAYSFSGTEIIGMTVGEAENPRKTVPKAIKRVFWVGVVAHHKLVQIPAWLTASPLRVS